MTKEKSTTLYQTPTPWTLVSEGYEKTTMPFLTQYSASAISLSNIVPSSTVLDLACGPGTLSRLLYPNVNTITALDFSPNMITLLNQFIQQKNIPNITTLHGDGQNLPFEPHTFDTIFSMFGLMFFPNRLKGLSECFRVLKPNGTVVISSWAPVSQSPLMSLMFGALKAANPELPEPETTLKNLECDTTFKNELNEAGFSNTTIHLNTHSLNLTSATHFWNDMVLGSAPIAVLKHNTPPQKWHTMEKAAIRYINQTIPRFPTSLSADAWIGIGTKPTLS